MIYIQQFLRALSPAERSRCSELQLTQAERDVLTSVMKHLDTNDVKAAVCAQLQIRSTYFDKTTSVLLQKCYALFASQDENAIFVFLNRKNLDALCHHELSKREKSIQASGSITELDAFYLNAFMMFRATNFDRYNPQITEKYAQKYLQHGLPKDNNEHARIRVLHLFVLLHYMRAVKPQQFNPQSFHEQLKDCEDIAGAHISPTVHFELCKARATLLRFETRLNEGIQQLDCALDLYEQQPQSFRVFDRVSLLCQKAEMLRDSSRFAESYQLCTTLFHEHEDLLCSMFHHINRYAEAAMLQAEYDKALTILDTYLSRFLDEHHVSVSTNACLSYAKVHLFLGHWKEAHHYIALGQQNTDKTLFFHSDVEFRNLQTICFFLQGDFETSELLANKSIKFLQQKARTAEIAQFISFFRIARGLIDQKVHNKKLSPKLKQSFESFQSGIYGVYGTFLRLMSEQARRP